MVNPRPKREPGDSGTETLWNQPGVRRAFRGELLKWYRRHARVLPWRETRDPYRIWISEIMLQQTTVVAVIPYYLRFFERFPTLQDLADAPEQDVLRVWEGLGYYSRARNLHRAAKKLVSEPGGVFPENVEALQELPGIGRYTAGAISSFAFDHPAPIVEANTQRLYARLLGMQGDPRTTVNQRLLWKFASEIHTARGSGGTLNQALMELGARVCVPLHPRCGDCPVQQYCLARHSGLENKIPENAPRKQMTDVHECALLIRRKEEWLMRQIPPGERWAGLWDFPRMKLGEWKPDGVSIRTAPLLEADVLEEKLRETFLIEALFQNQIQRLKHTVTRYRIQLDLVEMKYKSGTPFAGAFRWCTLADLHELPLPVTGRKIVQLLEHPPSVAPRLPWPR